MTRITGWPPGLLQDDSRELSSWFSSRLGARYQVDLRCAEIRAERLAQARARVDAAGIPTLPELIEKLGHWACLGVCGEDVKDSEATPQTACSP